MLPLQITAYQLIFRNVYGLLSLLFHMPLIKYVLLFVLLINYDKNDKILYSEIGKHRRCWLLSKLCFITAHYFNLNEFFPQYARNECAYIHVHYIFYIYVHQYMYMFRFVSISVPFQHLLTVTLADEFSVLSIKALCGMGSCFFFFVKVRTWFHSLFLNM